MRIALKQARIFQIWTQSDSSAKLIFGTKLAFWNVVYFCYNNKTRKAILVEQTPNWLCKVSIYWTSKAAQLYKIFIKNVLATDTGWLRYYINICQKFVHQIWSTFLVQLAHRQIMEKCCSYHTLRLIHITAFSACICGRLLRCSAEIEKFLSLQWCSPLRNPQTAAASVNHTLEPENLTL